MTKFAYNSFSRHDDWWIGIRYENGRCIFDSDESPANCSMMTHDGSFQGLDILEDIFDSDKCGYGYYHPINGYVKVSFYNCLDTTQFGIICEKSRNRN